LGALRALGDIDIVGVCDLSPVMAELAAERYGVRGSYTDYQQMIAEGNPDVVHIATPASTHYRLVLDCLAAGCHVVVEKPLTEDIEQFDQMTQTAEHSGLWLIEDFNYLFNRDVQAIRDWAVSGLLGDIRHVDIEICLDVFGEGSRYADRDLPHPAVASQAGVVSDFLTHLAYLALECIGPHVELHTSWKDDPRRVDLGPVEFKALVESDRATAMLSFSSSTQPDRFLFRVQGTTVCVETNLFDTGIIQFRALSGPKPLVPIRNHLARSRAEMRAAAASLTRKLSGGPGSYEGLWELVRRVYSGLRGEGDRPVSIAQMEATCKLVGQILGKAAVR
jgi:predicted dehydrogenase